MPEPFKNLFSRQLIDDVAGHLGVAWDGFDRAGFVAAAADNLELLELKQRSEQIERALERFLPADFERTAAILRDSLHPDEDGGGQPVSAVDGIAGWAIMPISAYVGRHGVEHLSLALDLMRELTMRFSAEFGIRYLILAEPERCLATLGDWTSDPNRHVRRLVSEGTRPRLPWAPRLPVFIDDPAPLLPLLTALRDDPEEYVRRSVANNLNDIAKDHPDFVAAIAQSWLLDAPPPRQRLIRHACRSLVKKGHSGALAALGYGDAEVKVENLKVLTPEVTFGAALEFELSLRSTTDRVQELIIDYVIHHQKANGSLSPKVFKWKTVRLGSRETMDMRRRHPMRKVTTRVYYPGPHRVEVQVNGKTMGRADFELTMPAQV